MSRHFPQNDAYTEDVSGSCGQPTLLGLQKRHKISIDWQHALQGLGFWGPADLLWPMQAWETEI
jgi:hypothetical protein